MPTEKKIKLELKENEALFLSKVLNYVINHDAFPKESVNLVKDLVDRIDSTLMKGLNNVA